MKHLGRRGSTALALAAATSALWVHPASASAFNFLKPICGAAGLVSGVIGKTCNVLQKGRKLLSAGKKLITGHPGAALKALGSAPSTASTALGLAAIVAWVLGGAKFALHETAKVLGETTSPQLHTTWFSSVYWRMAAIAAVLTLPFLFAAAVQSLIRSDLALLARATLGYLPLALLAVSVLAPLTMLLLALSDQLSAIVSSAAGTPGRRFLGTAGAFAGVLSLGTRSPFLTFLVGLLIAAGALVLWLELAIREAAVYVVVLMLPLAFAALVWPARRAWAVRAVELLIALVLSKFAIVAVLTLGGAALDQVGHSPVSGMVAGAALVSMAAFAPWALLRLLPFAEVAGGAMGTMRSEARGSFRPARDAVDAGAIVASGWIEAAGSGMRRQAQEAASASSTADGEVGATQTERLADSPAAGFAEAETAEVDAAAGSDEPLVSAPGGSESEPSGGDRLPGMGPIWQEPDMSWPTLTLGIEGWPPPRAGGDDTESTGPAEGSGPTIGQSEESDPRAADEHDPRVPEQLPPDEGL